MSPARVQDLDLFTDDEVGFPSQFMLVIFAKPWHIPHLRTSNIGCFVWLPEDNMVADTRPETSYIALRIEV